MSDRQTLNDFIIYKQMTLFDLVKTLYKDFNPIMTWCTLISIWTGWQMEIFQGKIVCVQIVNDYLCTVFEIIWAVLISESDLRFLTRVEIVII